MEDSHRVRKDYVMGNLRYSCDSPPCGGVMVIRNPSADADEALWAGRVSAFLAAHPCPSEGINDLAALQEAQVEEPEQRPGAYAG